MNDEPALTFQGQGEMILSWKKHEGLPPPIEIPRIISARQALVDDLYINKGTWYEVFSPDLKKEVNALRNMGVGVVQRKGRAFAIWVLPSAPSAFKSRDYYGQKRLKEQAAKKVKELLGENRVVYIPVKA